MNESPEPTSRPDSMRVDVVRGQACAEELAALIAVVTEAYREESAGATVEEEVGGSAWSATQRPLRTPLRRDAGWGRFIG